MARVLIPLPAVDFDPTEASVPWQHLSALGHTVIFATPQGQTARADERMLSGQGLGPWKPILRANARARDLYAAMVASPAFTHPLRYEELNAQDVEGLILPGGHAPGMRPYLESPRLQTLVAACFENQKAVGAICHGAVLAARSTTGAGKSVLHGRKTTALTQAMELSAWALTGLWLGDYYRTYPTTVQAEVTAALARPSDFLSGPSLPWRDSPEHPERGFTVRDGRYLSARWPGDAHRFASEFARLLTN